MKLGKETASVMNWSMSQNRTVPEAGKDCTLLMWTDRLSFHVLGQVDENTFVVAEYEDCYDEMTPKGTILRAPRHLKFKNGRWKMEKVDSGNLNVATGKYENVSMIFGVRNGYRDPCF